MPLLRGRGNPPVRSALQRTSGRLGNLRNRPARPPAGRLTDLYATAALAMIPLTVAVHTVLPPRYTYDSEVLRRIAAGEYNPLEDQSYLYVGRLYGLLGMAERPWAATVIGIGLAIAALYPALVRARGIATLPVYALVGLYVLTASVYLGIYSKDVWVLPVVLVVLLSRRGLGGEFSIVVAVSTYAYFFRGYWFLILAVYLGLRVLTAPELRRRRVVLGIGAVVAGVTLLSPWVLGAGIQSVRESVNLGRLLSADATTAISAPEVGLGPFGDVVENAVTFLGLVVPVPLVAEGPVYLVYAAAILLLWWMFARSVFFGGGRLFDGRPAAEADTRTLRAALFVLAVVTTQGFFEPDYGSYLRHLTPVLPLVIAVVIGRPGSTFLVPVDEDEATTTHPTEGDTAVRRADT